jgi:predicted DNA-binding transcriptional regulator AlpA
MKGRGIHRRPPRRSETTMTHPDTDLLTIAEAAALTRAPVATLRYWRHLGTGPRSFRLGRRVVYRRTDIDTWITDQFNATSARQA